MVRYEAGETLASIARTYDCSPPAISYIVSRSRDRQSEAEAAVLAAEPQLVKVYAEPAAVMAARPQPELALAPTESLAAPPPFADRNAGLAATLARGFPQRPNGAAAPAPQQTAPQANGQQSNGAQANGAQDNGAQANGAQANGAQANGDSRRTLRLSLGGNGSSNGAGNGAENGGQGSGHANGNGAEPAPPGNGVRAPDRPYPPQAQEPRRPPMPQPRYGFPQSGGERAFNESPVRGDAEAGRRNKDPGTFIDQELRSRVDGDIAVFLTAFDAALAGDTLESRAGLRDATDRLLRAGARTRIELERLEARIPLGAREGEGRSEPHWRHR